jgi:hypothetical protein
MRNETKVTIRINSSPTKDGFTVFIIKYEIVWDDNDKYVSSRQFAMNEAGKWIEYGDNNLLPVIDVVGPNWMHRGNRWSSDTSGIRNFLAAVKDELEEGDKVRVEVII